MAKLPVKGLRNVLVTSALPYVNNVPHLGNLIGSVLSADVFARYCRLRNYNVIYICGTDEYGTATEIKAIEENSTPQQICDKYHALHKKIYDWFDISFDKFGRTSTPQQATICQKIFWSLYEKNQLVEQMTHQLFCESCERFLSDRFLLGTCPSCGLETRGDQCDKCSHVLNTAQELIDPICKLCGNTPRVRETVHLFLDLPKLQPKIEKYVEETSSFEVGSWTANAVNITNGWLKNDGGLKLRCITRDLKWGVPVPLEKFKEKVFYVWYDAPIGYISITAAYTEDYEKWWKSSDVELFQFMGKDNVPFHTVLFPGILLGTEEEWTLMRTISVTEYLNYESGKFSKSKNVGVFGTDAQDTGIPVEVWRYYLLANRPEGSDAVFRWDDLQAKLNNELLKNLGNFVHRCLSFIAKPQGGYGSIVPAAPGAETHPLTLKLSSELTTELDSYLKNMEKVKLKKGLKIAMTVSGKGNNYLQESQFWSLYKNDPASCAIVMKTAAGLVKILGTLLEPFMPSFSSKVMGLLRLPLASLSLSEDMSTPWTLVEAGHEIAGADEIKPIFCEMKDDEMKQFQQRFGGSEVPADGELRVEKPTAKPDAKKQSAPKTQKPQKDAVASSIANVDIRVGLIKQVRRHPNADSLYVEEIDIGEAAPRVVVSGLVNKIPIEEMEARRVCVVCNLKPAKMRGILSEAMVLAASDESQVELLEPPEGAAVGERVSVEGFGGDPDQVLKKNDWEAVQAELRTSEQLVGTYKGLPLSTSGGVCTVKSVRAGSIR